MQNTSIRSPSAGYSRHMESTKTKQNESLMLEYMKWDYSIQDEVKKSEMRNKIVDC